MDLFALTGLLVMGTAITVPFIYLSSSLTHSILWGTIAAIPLVVIIVRKMKFPHIKVDVSSLCLLFIGLVFSAWMMFKTFHGTPNGELYVGSNNVFDFGFAIGLIRSMSWGANIPIQEPFFAGFPILYHYFFAFWVAVLEYFGIPLVWAMNIPSILSFTALLVVVYYVPQKFFGQKPLVGWVSVLLTVTNSSLTFWKLLPNLQSIWRLPTYPFAGPFDGSTISIFITLNNYVNQRHLAFSVALGLLLIFFTIKNTYSPKLIGFLSGIMILWNIPLSLLTGFIVVSLQAVRKKWKQLLWFTLFAVIGGILCFLPLLGQLPNITKFLQTETAIAATKAAQLSSWTPLSYLWENLGILPVVAFSGWVVIQRKYRLIGSIFLLLFGLLCLIAVMGERGFDQKFYSFLIIGVNLLAAIAIGWIWKKAKIFAVVLIGALTISGFVDLMPIKNEFAFPLIGKDTLPVIDWIKASTPKSSVFVSYADIIDPVVLAGRTNYYGFFKNIGHYDRSPDIARMYNGDLALIKEKGIRYILVPKNNQDFKYQLDLEMHSVVYKDELFTIYMVNI